MKIVNKEEFLETIKEGYTLVDFYADWCGPCKMLGPVLEELSSEVEDVKFIKVNVDDENDLAKDYGIMSIPAIFLFKDGEVVNNAVGFQPKEGILDFINQSK